MYGRAEIRNRDGHYRRRACAAALRNANEHGYNKVPAHVEGGSYAGRPLPLARPYPRDSASRDFFQPSAENIVGGEPPNHAVHLPVKAANIQAAEDIAASLAESLAHIDAVLGHDATVSEGDREPKRVFCAMLLADDTPCPLRWLHEGPCGAVPDTP